MGEFTWGIGSGGGSPVETKISRACNASAREICKNASAHRFVNILFYARGRNSIVDTPITLVPFFFPAEKWVTAKRYTWRSNVLITTEKVPRWNEKVISAMVVLLFAKNHAPLLSYANLLRLLENEWVREERSDDLCNKYNIQWICWKMCAWL